MPPSRAGGYGFRSHRCGNFRAAAKRCGVSLGGHAARAALRIFDAADQSALAGGQRAGFGFARAREVDRDGAGATTPRRAGRWVSADLLAAAERELHIASVSPAARPDLGSGGGGSIQPPNLPANTPFNPTPNPSPSPTRPQSPQIYQTGASQSDLLSQMPMASGDSLSSLGVLGQANPRRRSTRADQRRLSVD